MDYSTKETFQASIQKIIRLEDLNKEGSHLNTILMDLVNSTNEKMNEYSILNTKIERLKELLNLIK